MSWSVGYTFKSPLSAEVKATATQIIVDTFGDTSGPIGAGSPTFYSDSFANVGGHTNGMGHEESEGVVLVTAMTAFTKLNAAGATVKKMSAPHVNLLAYENGYIVLR